MENIWAMRLGSMSEHLLRRRETHQVFKREAYVHDSSVTFTVMLRSLITWHRAPFTKQQTVTRPPWQPSAVIHFASLTRLIHANRNFHHFHECFIPPSRQSNTWPKHACAVNCMLLSASFCLTLWRLTTLIVVVPHP